jgi:hypothetical protein
MTQEPGIARRLFAYILVALMALGSVAMWVGSPIGWLWIASQLVQTNFPTGGGYLIVLVGLIITTILLGRLLAALDRAHSAILGLQRDVRVRHGWHESVSAGQGNRSEAGVLERVMVVSVAFALVGMAAWFVIFAGSPLPS